MGKTKRKIINKIKCKNNGNNDKCDVNSMYTCVRVRVLGACTFTFVCFVVSFHIVERT